MVRITKIRPLSLARALTVIFFVVGLVVSLVSGFATKNFVVLIIVITLGYTLLGFISGFFGAVIYNLTLRLHGGVKIETEQIN